MIVDLIVHATISVWDAEDDPVNTIEDIPLHVTVFTDENWDELNYSEQEDLVREVIKRGHIGINVDQLDNFTIHLGTDERLHQSMKKVEFLTEGLRKIVTEHTYDPMDLQDIARKYLKGE